MYELITKLNDWSLLALFSFFWIENFLIAFIAVTLSFMIEGSLKKFFEKVSPTEILWAFCTTFFNTIITLIGYYLFKFDFVKFDFDSSLILMIWDFILLVILMDFLMYIFHFVIHRLSFIYKFHDLHHHYNKPTAITLFVLHPVEVLGFGMLWLFLLLLMKFSFVSVIVYLVFNVVMGIIGHLEKEFVPDFIKNNKYFKWLGTTSFHRTHHLDEKTNYGFYTTIWDGIFKTLRRQSLD